MTTCSAGPTYTPAYPLDNGYYDAREYFHIDCLLEKLPTNTDNEITARDVRDAVYTLWKRIDDFGTFSSVDITFTGTSSINIGGIYAGQTFSNTPAEMWDMLLNPEADPTIDFGFSSNYDEYITQSYFNSVNYPSINLEYNIDEKGYNPNDITVDIDGDLNIIGLNGTYTTSSVPTTGNKKSFVLNIDVDRNSGTGPIFSITSSFTIEFTESVFYKKQKLEHNGNYINYTLLHDKNIIPISYANNVLLNDIYIKNMNTSLDIIKNEVNEEILGDINNGHMLFAIPSKYEPKFYVNNMYNTAFTKIEEQINVSFSNGYFEEYDIWTTDSEQNYHLEKIKIKLQ